jgi:hypothetical protein
VKLWSLLWCLMFLGPTVQSSPAAAHVDLQRVLCDPASLRHAEESGQSLTRVINRAGWGAPLSRKHAPWGCLELRWEHVPNLTVIITESKEVHPAFWETQAPFSETTVTDSVSHLTLKLYKKMQNCCQNNVAFNKNLIELQKPHFSTRLRIRASSLSSM